jgi:hypothetical protein
MAGSDEDLGRSSRPDVEDRDKPDVEDRGWSSTGHVLDGLMIRRSGDAMCVLQCAQGDEEHGFLS